jgi:hypothetical protein|tara:strand:+ start:183 stop:515 length:333 start_codon:yes stop_codon:yes gene_type:complete
MSYWVHILDKDGESVKEFNYTSNVRHMFVKAFGHRDGIRCLTGFTAYSATSILDRTIIKMERAPLKYQKLEPSNGWGDYESCMNFLREILKECYELGVQRGNEHSLAVHS